MRKIRKFPPKKKTEENEETIDCVGQFFPSSFSLSRPISNDGKIVEN
jgi:hypothetical protein